MDVRAVVDLTVKKYKTRSPYELAELMDIQIHKCELGNIRGYYIKSYRIKQIYLNCNMEEHEERYVLAHEIGHAIMHPNSNTPFLRKNTYFSVDKLEIQANKFAIELLLPDIFLLENWRCTSEQLAMMTGYAKGLIELRLK